MGNLSLVGTVITHPPNHKANAKMVTTPHSSLLLKKLSQLHTTVIQGLPPQTLYASQYFLIRITVLFYTYYGTIVPISFIYGKENLTNLLKFINLLKLPD